MYTILLLVWLAALCLGVWLYYRAGYRIGDAYGEDSDIHMVWKLFSHAGTLALTFALAVVLMTDLGYLSSNTSVTFSGPAGQVLLLLWGLLVIGVASVGLIATEATREHQERGSASPAPGSPRLRKVAETIIQIIGVISSILGILSFYLDRLAPK